MSYPLHLSFKIIALAPQILVSDAEGRPLLYVKQKMFKLKESVQVYRDETKAEHLFDINANSMIDFAAKYTFSNPAGAVLGSVKKSGMRSLFKTHFTISDAADQVVFELEQTNPWIGMIDGMIRDIPIVGLFSGYIFNPIYAVRRPGSTEAVIHLIKKRTFLESGFGITREAGQVTPVEEELVLLSAIMATLLERDRS